MNSDENKLCEELHDNQNWSQVIGNRNVAKACQVSICRYPYPGRSLCYQTFLLTHILV